MKGFKLASLALILSLTLPSVASAVMVDTEGRTEIELNAPHVKRTGKVNGKSLAHSAGLEKGEYAFSNVGVLVDYKGKEHKNLFNDILAGAQKRIVSEVKKSADKKFTDTSIDASLAHGNDNPLWVWAEGLAPFYKTEGFKRFKMRGEDKEYSINVPKALLDGEKVNGVAITNAVKSIEKYQFAVKQAVVAGSLDSSFNLLSMYPSRQVPIVDILEDEKDKNGVKTGKRTFKKGLVTMNYALNSFASPILGVIDGAKVPKDSEKFWNDKVKSLEIVVKDGSKGSFEVKDSYLKVLKGQLEGDTTFQTVKAEDIDSTNALVNYATDYSGKTYNAKNRMDMAFYLMTPKTFTLDMDSNGSKRYKLGTEGGFRVSPSTKFLLVTDSIFSVDKKTGVQKRVGNYSSYGLNPKDLVLASTRIDSKGNYSAKGRKVGAVVPQVYREMVIHNEDSNSLYWTGRTIKFSNDYSGKITLDKDNRDLLAVDTKTTGKMGVELRKFAFKVDGDKKKADSHTNVGKAPNQFSVQIAFHNTDEVKGFYIYRNNTQVEDKDLIKWLKTDEAKAMTDVKAEELLKLLTGSLSKVENKKLTYEEWVRIQDIKRELDTPLKKFLIDATKFVSIIFGLFLIIYALFLMLAYLIDIVNTIFETSLVGLMTGGRLYSVTSKEDIMYSSAPDGVKTVTFVYVFVLMMVTTGIGLMFIYITPIISFLTFIYYTLLDIVGGA